MSAPVFHALDPGVTVIERGWLHCNQVALHDTEGAVLVDAGYGRPPHVGETLRAVETALHGRPLLRVVNTHCHSDHMGGNAALRRRFGCGIVIPAGEVRHVVPWTTQSCWSEDMDQYAEPFDIEATLADGDRFEAGGRVWRAIAAPGHDMDALVFLSEDGILLSGDALWERGMGFVWPAGAGEPNAAIAAARETLAMLAALPVRLVVPGHGAPFADHASATRLARERLDKALRDPRRHALQNVKSLFMFALLDKGTMRADELPGYLQRVPIYRRLREEFLDLTAAGLADAMLRELAAAGAIDVTAGEVRPRMRA